MTIFSIGNSSHVYRAPSTGATRWPRTHRASVHRGTAPARGPPAPSVRQGLGRPIELVEDRGSFLVFDDVDGTVESGGWAPWAAAEERIRAVEEGFLAVHPDTAERLFLLTTWTSGGMHRPLENQTYGIGWEHWPEDYPGLEGYLPADATPPTFDGTPDSDIKSIIGCGNWDRFYQGDNLGWGLVGRVVGQELGHAFGSFVYAEVGGSPQPVLLGVELAHWSLYMDTGSSPMDGLDWTDNGDGTFSAETKA